MSTQTITQSKETTRIREGRAGLLGRIANAAAALSATRLRFRSYEAPSDSAAVFTDLARGSGTSEHFVKDWLVAQAADAYIVFDPRTGRYAGLRRVTGNS